MLDRPAPAPGAPNPIVGLRIGLIVIGIFAFLYLLITSFGRILHPHAPQAIPRQTPAPHATLPPLVFPASPGPQGAAQPSPQPTAAGVLAHVIPPMPQPTPITLPHVAPIAAPTPTVDPFVPIVGGNAPVSTAQGEGDGLLDGSSVRDFQTQAQLHLYDLRARLAQEEQQLAALRAQQAVPTATVPPLVPPVQPQEAAPSSESTANAPSESTVNAPSGSGVGGSQESADVPTGEGWRNKGSYTDFSSPCAIRAGTLIPVQIVQAANNAIGGMLVVQTTEPIYDSQTQRCLLFPQGTRFIGLVGASTLAQPELNGRLVVLFVRAIFPPTRDHPYGGSLDLMQFPGADQLGAPGVPARVDAHEGKLLVPTILLGVLGGLEGLASAGGLVNAGVYIGALTPAQAATAAVAQALASVGQRYLTRIVDLPPTLSIQPGTPMAIIAVRDIILPEDYR
jgi:type IV secretory pathway VirB10-like protein